MGPDAMTKDPVSFDTMMKLWWEAQMGDVRARSYKFTYDGNTGDLKTLINKHFDATPCSRGMFISYRGVEVVVEIKSSRVVRITEQY